MTAAHLRHLLIVDDDPIFTRTLARAMEKRGYRVVAAWSVQAAMEAIEGAVFSHAIFDLRLHDGNGLDLVSALKQRNPRARAIILTSYGNIETAVAAIKLGAAEYLAKPADADMIEAALDGRLLEMTPARTFPRPEDVEFRYLMTVFEQHDRNMSETARAIGMHRRTLQRILRRHGVQPATRAMADRPSPRRRVIRLFRLWRGLLDGRGPEPRASDAT